MNEEIAGRARKLVELRGSPVVSTVAREYTGNYIRLGEFYIRVRTGGELYINCFSLPLAPTIFAQMQPGGGVMFCDSVYQRQLLKELRSALVLDELASI